MSRADKEQKSYQPNFAVDDLQVIERRRSFERLLGIVIDVELVMEVGDDGVQC